MMTRAFVVCVAAVLVGGGCQRTNKPKNDALVVFGAASLTESLTAAGTAWTEKTGQLVTFSFGSSSQNARQIRAGAPADVFASADAAWIEDLAKANLIDPDTRVDLLGNRLVVIVPTTAEFVPTDLHQLSDPKVVKIALAGEQVPAGRYADSVLNDSELATVLEPRITRGDSVRTVLHWVAQGQVDAGFVYATDAQAEERVAVAFEIPSSLQPDIVYPFAVVADSPHASEAAQFITFCQTEGKATFETAGFTVTQASR